MAVRGEVVVRGSSPGASSLSPPPYQCVVDQLGRTPPRSNCSGSLVSRREGTPDQHSGCEGSYVAVECLPGLSGRGVCGSNEGQCHRGRLFKEKTAQFPRHCDRLVDGVTFRYSQEEEHSGGPAQSP